MTGTPSEAPCWVCGSRGTHSISIQERPPTVSAFMVVLCIDCRYLVTRLLSNIKELCGESDPAEVLALASQQIALSVGGE